MDIYIIKREETTPENESAYIELLALLRELKTFTGVLGTILLRRNYTVKVTLLNVSSMILDKFY